MTNLLKYSEKVQGVKCSHSIVSGSLEDISINYVCAKKKKKKVIIVEKTKTRC